MNPGIDQLRLILLIAGVVFIAALVWLERRRPRQSQDADAYRGERNEPMLDLVAARTSEPSAPPAAGRTGDTARKPPVIDWSDVAGPPADDVPASSPTAGSAASSNERGIGRDSMEDAVAEPVSGTGHPEPPLVLEWPDESSRHIVSLRIVAARHDRLSGRALRQGLTGCGFRHGQFGIFHLPDQDGRVVLSAASLVRPGMLDPESMDFQRFSGINVFAVLPGPVSTPQALQQLATVADGLAQRVEGRVQDEHGAPLDATNVTLWRERCQAAVSARDQSAVRPD